MREKLAIFISGSGTTMAEIIKAQQNSRLNLDIACIISNDPNADGVKKARELNIPEKDILIIQKRPIENFGQRLLLPLQERGVTLISQNGWLPLTPKELINTYPNKIFNQHPGNPLIFGGKGMYGIRVHQAAINYFKTTGEQPFTYMTVQEVAPNFDEGQVLKVTPVEIFFNDTAQSLQARCLPIEHETVISFLEDFIKGKVSRIDLPKITDQDKLENLNLCRNNAISSFK